MIFKMLSRRAGKTAAARDAAYKKTMRSLAYGERTAAEILAALGHWYRDADRGTIDAVRDFRTILDAGGVPDIPLTYGTHDRTAAGAPVFWRPDQVDRGGKLPNDVRIRFVTDEDRARRIADAVRAGGA